MTCQPQLQYDRFHLSLRLKLIGFVSAARLSYFLASAHLHLAKRYPTTFLCQLLFSQFGLKIVFASLELFTFEDKVIDGKKPRRHRHNSHD